MKYATSIAVVLAIALPVMLPGSLAVAAPPAGSEGAAPIPGTVIPVTGMPITGQMQGTDAQSPQGEFMSAAAGGDTRRAEELLRQGVSVRIRNQSGETPLMLAALHGHDQMVRLLLERGADINAVSSAGVSVLAAAAYSGNPGIVKLLLGHGAIDKDGRALAFARQSGNQEVVRLVASMPARTGAMGAQSTGGVQATVTKIDRPDGCLRIRSGPSTATEKVGCASRGDNLVLSGVVQKGWSQVEYPTKGWVFSSQVSSPGLFPVKAATAGRRSGSNDDEEYDTWAESFDDDFSSEGRSPSFSMYDTGPSGYSGSSGYSVTGRAGIGAPPPLGPPPAPPPLQLGPVRIGY